MAHTVLLFASWADAFGPALSLDLPADTTAGAILDAAVAHSVAHAAGRTLPKPMVAVNHRYARPATPVRAGDEVALIPPVAGG